MAFWEHGSDCPLCQKKAIPHRYSHYGDTFTEYLHQNEDSSVVVCIIGGQLSGLMRLLEGDRSISLDKERERRQEYWKRRQLPSRFSHSTLSPANEAIEHCNDYRCTNDAVIPFTPKPIATKKIELTDSHNTNVEEVIPPSPASEYKN
jgi:hypothetical protein